MKFQIKTNSLNFQLKNAVIKEYPELENIEITPSKEEQTFKSQNYYGYNNVTINPVTNSIDENIKPENIKKDVSILGVTGNVEELNATEISINPSDVEKVITPDKPYNGFSKVTVGAQTGIDPAEYFETTMTSANRYYFSNNTMIKKTPTIKIDQSVTTLDYSFNGSSFLKSVNLQIEDSKELSCQGMFRGCTNLVNINGLENIKITNAQNMFNNTKIVSMPNIDLSLTTSTENMFSGCGSLKKVGNLNLINSIKANSMFSSCGILEEVGDINMPKNQYFNYTFAYNSALVSVGKINMCSSINNSGCFNSCSKLTNLGGLENLGQAYLTTQSANYSSYTLSLSNSTKLTHDSLMNVINGLYDIASGGVQPQKLILGSTNLAKLTDEEKAIATNKGWSLS